MNGNANAPNRLGAFERRFESAVKSFESIIQRKVGPFSKLAFKTAALKQPASLPKISIRSNVSALPHLVLRGIPAKV